MTDQERAMNSLNVLVDGVSRILKQRDEAQSRNRAAPAQRPQRTTSRTRRASAQLGQLRRPASLRPSKTYRLWALADDRGRLWTLFDGTPKVGARKPEGIQTYCPPPFRKVLKTPRTYRPVRVRVTVEAI
jgi:hypothetical protein